MNNPRFIIPKNVLIQSSFYPIENLSQVDWELYLKVRSVHKMKTVRRLNEKLNQILEQKMQITG